MKAILESDGKILILKRNKPEENWDLPGGLVERGEKEEDALTREVEEETGLVVSDWKRSGCWRFHRHIDGKWVDVQNYTCAVPSGKVAISHEHLEHKWIHRTDIKNFPVKDPSLYDALE